MSVKLESSVIFSNGTDTTEIFVKDIISMYIAVATPSIIVIGLATAVNYLSSTGYAYTAVNAASALRIVQQISDVRNGLQTGRVPIVDVAPTLIITNISPTNFDPTTDTLTVTGVGFYPNTIGKLRIEDAPGGGLDSNGYYMLCTYVSYNQLTAVPGGPGDGILGPGPVFIYYEDSLGDQSNVINGTNPSGTLITIP
jgi:hypothetical protein